MPLDPEIRSQLVRLLYTAMPQVASSTAGTVLLAGTVWYYTDVPWAAWLVGSAVFVMLVRLRLLVIYRRTHGDTAPLPDAAPRWEILYGLFSISMAVVIGGVLLSAFLAGSGGLQLLTTGTALGICGGQSTARVACRPWIPISSGLVILVSMAACSLIWDDSVRPAFFVLILLYIYTYVEACRHGGGTILRRLVAERELERMVRKDPLTGLGNRLGLEEEVERAYQSTRRSGDGFSLMLLDLDGFKGVNDRMGHPAGDAVLREVADRLRKRTRRSDYLARLGGDEFAIVVTDRHDRNDLGLLARDIIKAIGEPFNLEAGTARIGISIGVAMATQTYPESAAQLVCEADAALYAVKKAAKNNFAFAA